MSLINYKFNNSHLKMDLEIVGAQR
jgi:hypothetical protein